MDVKKQLARTTVAELHSLEAAEEAQREFERVFSSRNLPTEIPEVTIERSHPVILLSGLLREAGLAASNSEARRLIQQGGVRVDGTVVRDVKAEVDAGAGSTLLLQAGKRRFAKVIFS